MRRADLLCGGVLVALGALSLIEALRLRDDWQGAKLMPAAVGLVLVMLGTAHFAPATRTATASTWPDAARWRRIVMVGGALPLYVVALPLLGFSPATALFVLGLLRVLGAFSWTQTVVMTLVIAAASHVVFKAWLGMPLPSGLLGL